MRLKAFTLLRRTRKPVSATEMITYMKAQEVMRSLPEAIAVTKYKQMPLNFQFISINKHNKELSEADLSTRKVQQIANIEHSLPREKRKRCEMEDL